MNQPYNNVQEENQNLFPGMAIGGGAALGMGALHTRNMRRRAGMTDQRVQNIQNRFDQRGSAFTEALNEGPRTARNRSRFKQMRNNTKRKRAEYNAMDRDRSIQAVRDKGQRLERGVKPGRTAGRLGAMTAVGTLAGGAIQSSMSQD